jgi:chorismate mutase
MRAIAMRRMPLIDGAIQGSTAHGIYDGIYRKSFGRRIKRCVRWQRKTSSMDISDWRKRIDELDQQIVQLISKRAEAARAIGELKHKVQSPVYEPGREQTVFDNVRATNPGPLDDVELLYIYERIIDVMRTLQRRDK